MASSEVSIKSFRPPKFDEFLEDARRSFAPVEVTTCQKNKHGLQEVQTRHWSSEKAIAPLGEQDWSHPRRQRSLLQSAPSGT